MSTDVQEVALLGMCDRLGRLGSNPQKEKTTSIFSYRPVRPPRQINITGR